MGSVNEIADRATIFVEGGSLGEGRGEAVDVAGFDDGSGHEPGGREQGAPFAAVGFWFGAVAVEDSHVSGFMAEGFEQQGFIFLEQEQAVETDQALAGVASSQGAFEAVAELDPDLCGEMRQTPEPAPPRQFPEQPPQNRVWAGRALFLRGGSGRVRLHLGY